MEAAGGLSSRHGGSLYSHCGRSDDSGVQEVRVAERVMWLVKGVVVLKKRPGVQHTQVELAMKVEAALSNFSTGAFAS